MNRRCDCQMLQSSDHFRSSTRPCPATGFLHSGNPEARRKIEIGHGWVAQLAEQWTENPRVGGSIPPPAIPLKTRRVQQFLQQNYPAVGYTRSVNTRQNVSKRHIRPLPTVMLYVGGSLLRFDNGKPASRRGECPKRSEITEFSQKSRQRLRLSLAKVDQSKCGHPIFSGFTYPADFPLDQRTFKRHLKMFSQRFLRAFPKAGFHWKLEFQARGAAHFHPIFWNLGSDGEFLRGFRGWLARDWCTKSWAAGMNSISG